MTCSGLQSSETSSCDCIVGRMTPGPGLSGRFWSWLPLPQLRQGGSCLPGHPLQEDSAWCLQPAGSAGGAREPRPGGQQEQAGPLLQPVDPRGTGPSCPRAGVSASLHRSSTGCCSGRFQCPRRRRHCALLLGSVPSYFIFI